MIDPSYVNKLPGNSKQRTKSAGLTAEEVIYVPFSTPPASDKLSTLDVAKSFLQKQQKQVERPPLAFTPPSCSLGLTPLPAGQPIDVVPISYAHHSREEPMLVEPIHQGAKVVKFAEPIVQGTCLCVFILFLFPRSERTSFVFVIF